MEPGERNSQYTLKLEGSSPLQDMHIQPELFNVQPQLNRPADDHIRGAIALAFPGIRFDQTSRPDEFYAVSSLSLQLKIELWVTSFGASAAIRTTGPQGVFLFHTDGTLGLTPEEALAKARNWAEDLMLDLEHAISPHS